MPRQRRSTAIRTERKATAARKRAAFEFQTPNEKPLARAKGYAFACDQRPLQSRWKRTQHSHTRSIEP